MGLAPGRGFAARDLGRHVRSSLVALRTMGYHLVMCREGGRRSAYRFNPPRSFLYDLLFLAHTADDGRHERACSLSDAIGWAEFFGRKDILQILCADIR